MHYVGVKASHDATVAAVDEDGNLAFSIELEKLDNNPRYSKMPDLGAVEFILNENKIDDYVIAVDGWKNGKMNLNYHGVTIETPVATYTEFDNNTKIYQDVTTKLGWRSFNHIAGHLMGSYAASPFWGSEDATYCCVMDGGAYPRLYYMTPGGADYSARAHQINGVIYSIMSYYWGPFKDFNIIASRINPEIERPAGYDHVLGAYDIPGKLMAYIGLGKHSAPLFQELHHIYKMVGDRPLDFKMEFIIEHEICRRAERFTRVNNISDEDALRTMHDFLGAKLLLGIQAFVRDGTNLIFTGGSALNIKWNSLLRRNFNVWVPPFCNDTGSAIGQALLLRQLHTGQSNLNWDVYSGPDIIQNFDGRTNWSKEEGIPAAVIALLLVEQPEQPIIFLNGRAELGPRALGARSIIASARWSGMKEYLNTIKKREHYRPISPICLEDYAEALFEPGTPDPYMLFDHKVRPTMAGFIPAALHVDGTARLQTVKYQSSGSFNHPQNQLYRVLSAYHKLTGIPVLCNTSANFNGCGFFPDIVSAMDWAEGNGVEMIWSENNLYRRLAK